MTPLTWLALWIVVSLPLALLVGRRVRLKEITE